MKESTLNLMKKQLNDNTKLLQQLSYEVLRLRELGVGTMELLKQFEGYEDALEKLKETIKAEEVETKLEE